jgi:hypothetical protein
MEVDKKPIFNYNLSINAIAENFESNRGVWFFGVSVLVLGATVLMVVANGLPEGVSGMADTDSVPGTGNPDPCEEVQARIEDLRQNYERIQQHGASSEDIKSHWTREGALDHYEKNGEQVKQSYNRLRDAGLCK